MKATNIFIATFMVVFIACATPNEQGPSPGHGASSAMQGLAHLILSPLQIAAGLLEGIASVPYFLSTNIHEVNRGMVEAQAKIEAKRCKLLDERGSSSSATTTSL